ncbi:MAG TPA: ice-binding family protein [Acidimicrobiales bacterium]|nr:ice-binding family protein [Acidimicrobiales bacterium]
MVSPLRRCTTAATAVATAVAMVLLGGVLGVPSASAAQPPVGLGTATPFSVLGGQTITNTGPSVISGSLGLSPGNASSVTGFPPGLVTNGSQHAADGVALQAQNDLTTAYNSAAGRTPVTVESNPDLGGQNLVAGVYKGTSSLSLTGTVTLNGENNANAVFIFQAGSTLITASHSTVRLINGAQWCNVFWQVGSSATLGTATTFVGTVMALTSATLDTGATVSGRILARNGAVTLDSNTIGQPGGCVASTTTGTTATPSGNNQAGGGPGGNARGSGVNGNGLGGGVSGNGLGGGVVPFGSPSTGFGGAAHAGDPVLVAAGGMALVGAVLAMIQAIRRRRVLLGTPGGKGTATDDG